MAGPLLPLPTSVYVVLHSPGLAGGKELVIPTWNGKVQRPRAHFFPPQIQNPALWRSETKRKTELSGSDPWLPPLSFCSFNTIQSNTNLINQLVIPSLHWLSYLTSFANNCLQLQINPFTRRVLPASMFSLQFQYKITKWLWKSNIWSSAPDFIR